MKASMYNMELDMELPKGADRDRQFYDPCKTPYEVDEQAFPAYDGIREQFLFLLRYALLAPSSHNTQPWKFRLLEGGIAVYADYGRRLPVKDPGNRELLISVGAAVMNLRIAASRFGFTSRVDHNQGGDSLSPAAFVHLSRPDSLPPADRKRAQLFPAIVRRHTNRHPFLMARIPEQVVTAIQELTVSGTAAMTISRDGVFNQKVADLVARADIAQQADASYRRETAEWVRPNFTRKMDGVTGANLGLNDLVSMINPWATRNFDLGRLRAARDKNLCLEAPGLIVIHSEDSFQHWLDVGELLQRVLLTLTRNTVQVSFFNMLTEVPDLRTELRSIIKISSWPQLILRMGYCLTEPACSSRRPLEEVLMSDSHPGSPSDNPGKTVL